MHTPVTVDPAAARRRIAAALPPELRLDALKASVEQVGDSARLLNPSFPEPHSKQQEFIDTITSEAIRRAVLLWGRRAGKTIGMSILAAEAFRQGWRVLYASPTTDQIERFWYAVRRYFHDDIKRRVLIKNETKHLIERPNSGENDPRIRAKTAWSSDTLRGDWGTLILLDEYQLMKDDLDEVILPMLIDTNGIVVYAGTPEDDPANQLRVKYELAQKSDRWETWHIPSHDNPHLSREALEEIAVDLTPAKYEREIEARFSDTVEGALWKQDEMIDAHRWFRSLPLATRSATAIDPASWTGETGVMSGFAAMVDGEEHYFVTADDTSSADPNKWGPSAAAAFHRNDSDILVYERNQGGKMVAHTIAVYDKSIQMTDVWASRAKVSRAEPVAALYAKGRVHHVGNFVQLEHQMTTYIAGNKSPDRMDSLVWLITHLAGLGKKSKPRLMSV